MKAPPRVVLDTNVALSALLFAKGRLIPLRQAWQSGRFRPVVSSDTAGELMRVLHYPKFRLSAEKMQELLAEYLPWCETVRMPARRPKVPACRDPSDLPFLQLAIAAEADFLVTGDQDLLALAGKFACPIVTPERFLGALGKD